MEPQEEQESFRGVLLGIVTCQHGSPFIAMDINGSSVVMDIEHAGIVFEQFAGLLGTLGYFGDEGFDDEVPPCRLQ